MADIFRRHGESVPSQPWRSPRQDRATCHGSDRALAERLRSEGTSSSAAIAGWFAAPTTPAATGHCPKCQGLARAEWPPRRARGRVAAGAVFTTWSSPSLPPVAEIAFQNKRAVYAILFRAAPMRCAISPPSHVTSVQRLAQSRCLHTLGQTLQHHPHLHCIVPGGGLLAGSTSMGGVQTGVLPARCASSRRFRTLFLARLQAAFVAGELRFSGTPRALAAPNAFAERLDTLRKVEMGGLALAACSLTRAGAGLFPAAIPIASPGNSRLTRLADGRVDFTWKDYHHGKTKVLTLAADEFIRRVPSPRRAERVPPHPPCRLPRERPSHRKAGAVAVLLAAPTPEPPPAESYRVSAPAGWPRNRCLSGLWRRDAERGRRRAVHSRRRRSGATAHDQEQSHPINQSELRRRCPHQAWSGAGR